MRVEPTRQLLQTFDFHSLFCEQLGWSNPANLKAESLTAKDQPYTRQEIAQLSGASVYEITMPDGVIPDKSVRAQISQDTQKVKLVHILIFVDKARTQCVWRWLKRETGTGGKTKEFAREHLYLKGQPGDLFLAKLSPLFFDISELNEQGRKNIVEVSQRIEKALDVKSVTKEFYRDYQQKHLDFLELIGGIADEADRRWYASVLLNRLMFIYFLQKKQFLDRGKVSYLGDKLKEVQTTHGNDLYYSLFLQKLFFEGFAIPDNERSAETRTLIGQVKYLNGGLFLKHKIELKYDGAIQIPDVAFTNLFQLFDSYSWTLNDTPGDPDNEINPDVLGYIFEKYINQKAFGAYYTPPEITDYLCEQTVYKLILDAVNGPLLPDALPDGLAQKLHRKRFVDVPELLINLDADICRRLVVGDKAILPNLSLLDPSCGSGAFLVAAMKTLINVYSGVLGKIPFLGDSGLTQWKTQIEHEHPSVNYYIKKQIITNNLYGVDLMEEATEIAKLRLFLTLVASAEKISQLEPLPNIDFNIMPGNSLIGLLRVDSKQFDQYDLYTKGYGKLVQEKAAAVRAYKHAATFTKDLQTLRDSIDKQRREAIDTLNNLTLFNWHKLGIKYEEATWDVKKNALGKPVKRTLKKADIEALEPFHWSFEFDEIMVNKGGFDAIITNPPWEIVKPQGKEFFAEYSDVVTKNKMTIKDFEQKQDELLQQPDVRQAWLDYLSRFPHVSQFYRSSPQYVNQISVVNGKKAGTDINLYKLFTEQCYNLLRKGGYCGIVIPSGIYTDLGTKQLRKLLFEHTELTGLFCFENRKEIFEGVHRSFKFVVLSFERGGSTTQFPTAFMRHDVAELETFPANGANLLAVDFIKNLSPDSWSVMEVKDALDFQIAAKMLDFPMMGDEDTWQLGLTREFDMTNDSKLFKSQPAPGMLPLYEGKMVWQFDPNYLTSRYWIDEQQGRKAILGRRKDDGKKLDYQTYRLGFRDIAANTNERTFVSCIIPPAFHGNKLPTVINIDDEGTRLTDLPELVCLCSIWNSYVVDWHLRNRVTTTLNYHYVYQTPVPRLREGNKWFSELVERAAKLICTTPEFADLWNDVMPTTWTANSGVTDESGRNQLRAEIDAIVATIYGLTQDEFEYILTTFPLVADAQKQETVTEFKKLQAVKPATVFMSYAHEDAAQVEKLHQVLTAKGLQVWKDDEQLLPGENWEHKIEVALKEHEFVIVCLSANSVGKRGFFQVELKKAARKQAERSVSDVYIIPAKLSDYDTTKLPAEINAIQYVDLSKDWDKGIEAVVKTVEKYRQ